MPNGNGVPAPATPDEPITEGVPEILSDAAIEPHAYRGIRLTIRDMVGGNEANCRILPVQGDQFPRDDWSRSRKGFWSAAVASIRGACPNIDRDTWGLVILEESEVLASQRFTGNCFGLTFGRFIDFPPRSALINDPDAHLRYVDERGGTDAEARAAATAALDRMGQDRELMGEVARLSIQAIAGVDATVTKDDSRARYGWFGEHIALKLDAPLNQWISRNTKAAPIYVHSTLEQLAEGVFGELIAMHEADPAPHILVESI